MPKSNSETVDFDEIIDRRAVGALKFDPALLQSVFGRQDLWPSWVADMDFKAASEIQNALRQRVEHGVYGYESDNTRLPEAVCSWLDERYDWSVQPGHILFSPRTLTSISVLISLFSNKGDGVIIQPPVFYDFKMLIHAQHRKLVKNPLKLEQGTYQMDFEQLESVAAQPENSLLILCNPHNPIGRVWSRETLSRLAKICAAHQVFVIADEIHGDITYQHRYTPFASLSDAAAQNCASCVSPVKSFNLAGVANSMIVIDNEDKRQQCKDWFNQFEINKNNVFTTSAMLAAYTRGGDWLQQVTHYLQQNIDTVRDYLQQQIPSLKMIEPEGSYLLWLDFRALNLDAKQLSSFLVEQAGIAGNPGHWFGREGAGFARINIACPKKVLLEALAKLKTAVDALA